MVSLKLFVDWLEVSQRKSALDVPLILLKPCAWLFGNDWFLPLMENEWHYVNFSYLMRQFEMSYWIVTQKKLQPLHEGSSSSMASSCKSMLKKNIKMV